MSFDTNLPPGCSSSDVEEAATPDASRYCEVCGTFIEEATSALCDMCTAEKLDTIICDMCELPFPRHQVDRVGLIHICKACRHEHQSK